MFVSGTGDGPEFDVRVVFLCDGYHLAGEFDVGWLEVLAVGTPGCVEFYDAVDFARFAQEWGLLEGWWCWCWCWWCLIFWILVGIITAITAAAAIIVIIIVIIV